MRALPPGDDARRLPVRRCEAVLRESRASGRNLLVRSRYGTYHRVGAGAIRRGIDVASRTRRSSPSPRPPGRAMVGSIPRPWSSAPSPPGSLFLHAGGEGYADVVVRHVTGDHARVLGSLARLGEVRAALEGTRLLLKDRWPSRRRAWPRCCRQRCTRDGLAATPGRGAPTARFANDPKQEEGAGIARNEPAWRSSRGG
jgi:hypothetical protein